MAKKQYPNYDDTLFGQYIRQIENPDSVGWNPFTRTWHQSSRRGDDKRNRGMGVDVLNNNAAKTLTKNRPGKYLTEAEEHQIRNEHIDYLLGVVERQKKNHLGLTNMSPRKQAEVLGALYRGDAKQLWDKNSLLGKALESQNEEDFHHAINTYYNSKNLRERAINNNQFWYDRIRGVSNENLHGILKSTPDNITFPSQRPVSALTKQDIIDAVITIPTAIAEGMDKAVTFGKSMFPQTSQKGSPNRKDNTMRWAEGGFLYQPKDAWDSLSMLEKSEMIKVAVRNGITDLKTIREKYNEFAEDGSVDTDWSYNSWKRQIAEHMGIKPDEDNTYDYEAYFNKYPEEAWKMLKGDPTAHFSDEFKTVYHPTFSSKSVGNDGSIYSGVVNSKTNPQGLVGGTWSPDYHTFTMSPDGYRGPVSMDERKWYLENAEDNGAQLREADGSLPIFDGIPWGGVLPNVTITGNRFAKGGGIHIKPSHRGRLTELKKRTGKTEAELYRTGSPATRKMITFARSARKWHKHDLGGYLKGQVYDIPEDEVIRLINAGYEIEYL